MQGIRRLDRAHRTGPFADPSRGRVGAADRRHRRLFGERGAPLDLASRVRLHRCGGAAAAAP